MNAVEENIVTPVSDRIANSYLNPYILSCILWERTKNLAPGRARDCIRIATTAVTNALKVYNNDSTAKLKDKSNHLQNLLLTAFITEQGRDVVLNSVSLIYKMLVAMNTPETRVAIEQLFDTVKHMARFLATPQGQEILNGSLECCELLLQVAASADSSILLAEIATNICFALEIEEIRLRTEKQCASAEESQYGSKVDEKPKILDHVFMNRAEKELSRAERSAKIEKDVLSKMGVDPSLFTAISRVLEERIPKDEEDLIKLRRNSSSEDTEDAQQSITLAFGTKISETELTQLASSIDPQTSQEDRRKDDEKMLLPDWHEAPFRAALQQMHLRRLNSMTTRGMVHGETSAIPSKRTMSKIVGSNTHFDDFETADAAACRLLSKFIIYGFILFILACSIPVFMRFSRMLDNTSFIGLE